MRKLLLSLLVALTASSLFAAVFGRPDDVTLIQEIRGKKFEQEVTRRTISRQSLRDTLRTQMEKGLTLPPAEYVRVLRALHLLGDQQEPLEKLLNLYEAQVLAFYDPVEHVYYAIDKPPAAAADIGTMLQDAVSVHEMMHALQDQVFDAGEKLESLKGNWDRQLAYHAILEGEATLVMLASIFQPLGKTVDDLVQDDAIISGMTMASGMTSGIPADTPAYFVSAMKFPYVDGLRFVVAAYRKGGWAEIDRLHESPPSSTEQIIHPELYYGDAARATPAVITTEATTKSLVRGSLGEFHWRHLVGNKAAAGWGADVVEVIEDRRKRPTVIVDTKWDTEDDAREFADGYRKLLEKKGEKPTIAIDETRVIVGYGADRKLIAKRVR